MLGREGARGSVPSLPDSLEDKIDMAATLLIPMLNAFADIEMATYGRTLIELSPKEVAQVSERLAQAKREQFLALEDWYE